MPESLKLQRYMDRANSGKYSSPALVVSDSVQIWESESPSSFERSRRSRARSPDMVLELSPTADLNRVSNCAWSLAVMNDSRILGILFVLDGRVSCWREDAPAAWKEAAIWLKPVAWGFTGAGGACVGPEDCWGDREKPVRCVGWKLCCCGGCCGGGGG